jgi:hypothetical protein
VPLGFVSLTKNLIMIAMAVWMALGVFSVLPAQAHGGGFVRQRDGERVASPRPAKTACGVLAWRRAVWPKPLSLRCTAWEHQP